jgi:hypothetical protein
MKSVLSEGQTRSLQGLSNIYLLQPPISEDHAQHLLKLGFVTHRLGSWVLTAEGRAYLKQRK